MTIPILGKLHKKEQSEGRPANKTKTAKKPKSQKSQEPIGGQSDPPEPKPGDQDRRREGEADEDTDVSEKT